jgi:prephenate dehydrogenase
MKPKRKLVLPQTLAESSIAMVGLGLMGGSLAMALKGQCANLVGVDLDPAVITLADGLEIFDSCSTDPKKIIPQANVIILATPIQAILKIIEILPSIHPGPAIVLDIGSTKTQIVNALEKLPSPFDPLGGHPMCGKEKASILNADPKMFRGAPFAFVSLERTTEQTRNLAEQIAGTIGANPIWLGPTDHDRWVAYTSHLPYFLSTALSLAVPPEAGTMIGPGFRSTSRLSATPSSMMMDILKTNRDNIAKTIDEFLEEVEMMRDLLVQGKFDQLQERLDLAVDRFQSYTH